MQIKINDYETIDFVSKSYFEPSCVVGTFHVLAHLIIRIKLGVSPKQKWKLNHKEVKWFAKISHLGIGEAIILTPNPSAHSP